MDTNPNSSDNHSPDSANLLPRSIDWAAIHLAYTTSSSSTRDIGRAHGVTHAAIGKRARREGWERPEKEEPVSAKLAKLEPRQQRFVEEYMVDMNATQAAIRAGYSADTAQEQSSRLLSNVMVQAGISAARKVQQERTAITADTVLMEIANVALADARELVEVKTGCCRCCYGEGHKYQRTLGEYNHDRDQWLAKGKELAEFEDQGGIGFNPLKLPHPECPNCGGDGDARVVLKDTRTLSPQALALYAGAKTGKYGIEVQMHSKMDALEKLAKHVGLYEKDNTQKNDPLALRNMTDAERAVRMSSLLQANPALVATLAQLMATGAQQ